MEAVTSANMLPTIFPLAVLAFLPLVLAKGPFLASISENEHIIGNDLWNVTIGMTYGTKLFYKNHDCVGEAVGHYVSYSMLRCLLWPLYV